jgi:hypothetical protein
MLPSNRQFMTRFDGDAQARPGRLARRARAMIFGNFAGPDTRPLFRCWKNARQLVGGDHAYADHSRAIALSNLAWPRKAPLSVARFAVGYRPNGLAASRKIKLDVLRQSGHDGTFLT